MKSKIRAATKGQAIGDLESLKRQTITQCELEFERRWNQPFRKPGGGGIGSWLVQFWEAAEANKKIEDDARELYEKLRKRLERVGDEAAAFRSRAPSAPGALDDVPFGSGGIAVQALYQLEAAAAQLREALPPISQIEEFLMKRLGEQGVSLPARFLSRRDGRSAFVAMLVREAGRPPLHFADIDGDAPPLSNRDIAVACLLCGVTSEWAAHARDLAAGELVTPAKVLEAEETRVRRIRSTLPAEPSGSGSVSP